MLKLAENFFITSVFERGRYALSTQKMYKFRYKNYCLELDIQFEMLSVTKKSNIAIINFGYTLDIREWSDRKMKYIYINDLDTQDGRSTKRYFDSKKGRELVLRFIEKTLLKYLKTVQPALLIRGALSDIKTNLPRYKRFDKCFLENGYKKRSIQAKDYKSLHKITSNYREKDANIIWAYAKKKKYFKELKSVHATNSFS